MSAVVEFSGLDIRPMSVTDLDQVMQIEERAYPFPWTRGIFSDCIRVGYGCWLLQDSDMIIGYGVLSWGPEEAHLLNITVTPDRQGEGLGRYLLEDLIDKAIVWGAKELFLEVRPSNESAIGLYRDRGFNEIGLRPDYYPDHEGREDAVVMALPLVHEL